MKQILIAFVILTPLLGFSQRKQLPSRKAYEGVPGIKLVDPLTWEHLKGGFSFGDVHVSYMTHIDSNKTFKMVERGCVGDDIVLNQGTWQIKDNNLLILKTSKKRVYLDVLKFGNFLFCVNAQERIKFVEDLQKEWNTVSNYKIDSAETRYTRAFFVAFHLFRKYPRTELIH